MSDVKKFFESESDLYKKNLISDSLDKFNYINYYANEDDILVDIGCGSGNFLQNLRYYTPITKIVGLDIAKNMLPDNRLNGRVCLGDARNLPIKDSSVKFVHIDVVLHHIVGSTRTESKQLVKQTIRELLRVIKPSGHLIITERCQIARLIPDRLLAYAIFYGLKYTTRLIKPFHENVRLGQPPISFYTEKQLINMIDDTEGSVQDIGRRHYTDLGIRSIFQTESQRVTFYIRPE